MTRFIVISSLEDKFIISMEQVVLTIKLSIYTHKFRLFDILYYYVEKIAIGL